jgi:NADPH2:quinone reductase
MLLYGVHGHDLQAAIERTQSAVAAGALTTLPLLRFTLEQAQEAHDAVEQGAVGKVLIDLP